MEVYKNIKKETKIGLVIAMFFVVIGIVSTSYNLFDSKHIPDNMVEMQNPPIEMSDPQQVPTMPNAQKPSDEMIGEGKPVPSASPEIPTVGMPGYVKDIIYLVIYAFTGFYALIGYKKPHGNMLKYLFIAFAIGLILNTCLGNNAENTIIMVISITSCLAALILVYVSGRFHKIEKNKILLVLTGVLLFITTLLPMFSDKFIINGLLNSCSPLIMHFALCFAYTARYEEHKTAGLEEAK